jgi:transcriptional regulator with XRE-family HTH domain
MGSKPYHDPNTLERLYYEEGLTQKEIADKYGVAHQTISRWMERHDINPGIETGQFDETPGASFFTVKEGYEIIAAWNKETQQMDHVKHHRLLMYVDSTLGELSGQHVHHRNGIKWDNRTENLETRDPTEHIREHAQERDHDQLLTAEESRDMVSSWGRDEKGQFRPEE